MICPECGSRNIYVSDTNPTAEDVVMRWRRCADCGTKFTTIETIADRETWVAEIKKQRKKRRDRKLERELKERSRDDDLS